MAVRIAFLILLIATVTMTLAPLGHGDPDKSPEAMEEWFDNLPNARQELTKLHFYLHEIRSGPNPSTVAVAEPNVTWPNNFGRVDIVDELITEGPEYSSRPVGRIQGMTTSVSKEALTFVNTLSIVFQGGQYSGSTLNVHGIHPQSDPYLELTIVSGTGVFRLATGMLTASLTVDPTSGNIVVECRAFIIQYAYLSPSRVSIM